MNTQIKTQLTAIPTNPPNMQSARGFNQSNCHDSQAGIGLIEVLVALLLLAVAALGYSALQARSMAKTDESLTRTQAINLIHTASEMIKVNAVDMSYTINLTKSSPDPSLKTNAISDYQSKLSTVNSTGDVTGLGTIKNCDALTACSQGDLATYDVAQLFERANAISVKLSIDVCPGTNGKGDTHCVMAVWKDTTATQGDGLPNCIKSNGKYNFGADCVYMEAY